MNIINHISIFGLITLYFYSIYIYLTISKEENKIPYWVPLLATLGLFAVIEAFVWLIYFSFFY